MKRSRKNPSLALKDPYGDGWLGMVQARDSKIKFRKPAGAKRWARMWTEDSALRLRQRVPVAIVAALAQYGGFAVDDIPSHLLEEDSATLIKEFFLL